MIIQMITDEISDVSGGSFGFKTPCHCQLSSQGPEITKNIRLDVNCVAWCCVDNQGYSYRYAGIIFGGTTTLCNQPGGGGPPDTDHPGGKIEFPVPVVTS